MFWNSPCWFCRKHVSKTFGTDFFRFHTAGSSHASKAKPCGCCGHMPFQPVANKPFLKSTQTTLSQSFLRMIWSKLFQLSSNWLLSCIQNHCCHQPQFQSLCVQWPANIFESFHVELAPNTWKKDSEWFFQFHPDNSLIAPRTIQVLLVAHGGAAWGGQPTSVGNFLAKLY